MATGQRSSTRIKQKPTMAWERQFRRVEMAKEDCIKDLKHKVGPSRFDSWVDVRH